MNLSKLFELQRQVDEHIEREYPSKEGEDRLVKKILALQVELGELASKWRGFKFWSHNQKPRKVVYEICKYCEGRQTLGFQQESCWYCGGTGLQVVKRPLLEEYVDCLHFILSIGLELEITDVEIDSDYTHEDPSATFVELFGDTWELFNFRETDKQSKFIQTSIYERMFNRFVGIGEKHLGFTLEQVEQAYLEKVESIMKGN